MEWYLGYGPDPLGLGHGPVVQLLDHSTFEWDLLEVDILEMNENQIYLTVAWAKGLRVREM